MLLNLSTQLRTWEHEFRALSANISFPEVITDEMLAGHGYAVLHYPEAPIPPSDSVVIDAGQHLVSGEWRVKWDVIKKDQKVLIAELERLKSNITALVQERLDAFAQTRGYDSIQSLSDYAGDEDAAFNLEGTYGKRVRSQTWRALITIMEEVTAKTRPMPTGYADVEPLLPPLVWPA